MISHKKQDELEYIEVSNQSARAKIALQGAHIFFFYAKGEAPLLWLSKTSTFQKRKEQQTTKAWFCSNFYLETQRSSRN